MGRRQIMSKLHYTKYQENYKNYILNCLDDEDALIGKNLSREEKIKYLFDRFYSEYGFMVDRVGKQKAIAEWLSGIAINIHFYNEDIIKLAQRMGSVNDNLTSSEEDKICQNYWHFMANIILLLEKEIIEVTQ
jgi:hypothetical protein